MIEEALVFILAIGCIGILSTILEKLDITLF